VCVCVWCVCVCVRAENLKTHATTFKARPSRNHESPRKSLSKAADYTSQSSQQNTRWHNTSHLVFPWKVKSCVMLF